MIRKIMVLIVLFCCLMILGPTLGCCDKPKESDFGPTLVEWGLPSDCHAGHADGKLINGLVQASDCHAGHFDGNSNRRISLPTGREPTEEDYKKVIDKHSHREEVALSAAFFYQKWLGLGDLRKVPKEGKIYQ